MRRNWTGRLHEIGLVTGSNARVYRFCKNCGATWELATDETGLRAFQPIQERGADGKLLETDVDVRECPAEVSAPAATVAAASVANASVPVVASRTDERKCYCSDCQKAGRKVHFEGDEMCYCPRHKGREKHKLA